MLKNVISVLHELGPIKITNIDLGEWGGGNWEMVAILQEIGQDMFSKTFLHTKPTNAHEFQSFLGMANYSSKYIQNFATITAPLQEFMKHNVRFKWSAAHDEAFNTSKRHFCTMHVVL